MNEFWREPDVWHGEAHGFTLYAQRNSQKAWCGYIVIPEEHPLFGKSYSSRYLCNRDEIETTNLGPIAVFAEALREDDGAASLDCILSVHGGLTFSGECYWLQPRSGWALGFDCSHCDDLTPASVYGPYPFPREGAYRTLEYVKEQLVALAKQVATFNLEPLYVHAGA